MAASDTATVPIASVNNSVAENSGHYAAVVVPSDTVNFQRLAKGLYVGGTGNIYVVLDDDTTCLFSSVPAGTIIPVRCKRVNSTVPAATTATLMVAFF